MEVLNALLQLADARGHFNHWMLRSRKGLSCTLMMWYCSRHQPAGSNLCQGNSWDLCSWLGSQNKYEQVPNLPDP
jgi:hypothetical protein